MWEFRWLLLFMALSSFLQSVHSFHFGGDSEGSYYEMPEKSFEPIITREPHPWKSISILKRQVKHINERLVELIHRFKKESEMRPKREIREDELVDAMEKIMHNIVHKVASYFRDTKKGNVESRRIDLDDRSILSSDKGEVLKTKGQFADDDNLLAKNDKEIRKGDQKLHDVKQKPSLQNAVNLNENKAKLPKSTDVIKNNISVPSANDSKIVVAKQPNVIINPEINKSNVNTAASNSSTPIKPTNEIKTANVSNIINSPTQTKTITSNNMTQELQKPVIKRTPDLIINANRQKRLDLKRGENHEIHPKEICSHRLHANYGEYHDNDHIYRRNLESATQDLMKKRTGRHIDKTDEVYKRYLENAAQDLMKKRYGRDIDEIENHRLSDTLRALNNGEGKRYIPIISNLAPRVLPRLQDISRDRLGHVLENYVPGKDRLAFQGDDFD